MSTDLAEYAIHHLDIHEDIDASLRADMEETPEYEYELYGSFEGCDHNLGHIQILWCPETLRAGLVYVGSGSSGVTSWTDADSPKDALRRYLEDEMSN